MTLLDGPPVEVTEYGAAQARFTAAQERTLRRLAGGKLTILPGDRPDEWRIKASNYVGTVAIPGVRILIKPKVSIENLFYILETDGAAIDVRPAVFDYDTTGDLVPAFATFYARCLESALACGVPRGYREVQDRVPGIRGRVDIPARIRLAGLPLPVDCRFDEYTADLPLNRILRAATDRLVRLSGVTVSTRQTLRRLVEQLGEVGPLEAGDMRTPVVFTRLNEHCRSAERLARLVLRSESLLGETGQASAGAFLIDMNMVFQEFVAARLARYLSGKVSVHPQYLGHLDVDRNIRIKPDLVFKTSIGRAVYVADTKYKITDDGFGRESDYYQILAYTGALNVPEGILIYCQRDGSAPPRVIEVAHFAKRLATWPLSLDGAPSDIERRLRDLAVELVKRALAIPFA